jgi:pimeloyl-ACP methyl ester carboxylesterase
LFASIFLAAISSGRGATLAGQQVKGGGKIEIRFPVSKYFQDIAAEAGNPRVETGRAVLTFPPSFDPSRTWPILIVTSTSDFNRTSVMDAEWYRAPATAEGWIVLGSDATISPRIDSTQWRLAMLAAALEAVRKEWPQSSRWPVAFAGFSGGSKRSGTLGAMLAKTGSIRVCGFFLSGINEDRLSEGYKTYQPGRGFLEVPVWLSSGDRDTVALPQSHILVKASLERTGFKRVRLEQFSGGHQLKMSEVRRALQWFRQLGGF